MTHMHRLRKKKFKTIDILGPTIKDTEKIIDALKKLRGLAMTAHTRLSHLAAIIILPEKGYENLLFPSESIYVCKYQTVRESSVPYLASLLIPESVHLQQFTSRKKF